VVNEWCAASGAEEIVVSSDGWSDPAGTAAVVVSAHPADVVSFWQTSITSAAGTGDWLERWQAASAAAVQAVDTAAVTLESPNEPGIARDVVTGLPDRAQLVVSSSMPIRDVERYASPRRDVRVWSNRGANGIDGVVSTAIGVALGSSGPTGLLIGDIALLHDSNGLLGAAERGIDLVCVVVDNDGGGIFSFLPQAGQLPEARFELLFGTPHGVDLVALAAAYGVEARRLDADADLVKAVAEAADQGGVHVLAVATDRAANVEAHGIIDDATAAAVDTALKSYSP
jgi:2-succinyl-5-enolpyruvyl-6-hydroxy-3-cyclohexene-1-carboxylate synthase